MPRSRRVLVIGAGVIGSGVAWRLADRGVAVTVLEAATPGAGTTGASFAWVNASSKFRSPREYFELNAEATREHHAWAAAFGETRCFFPTGDLELALDERETSALEAKVAWLGEAGYGARLLSWRELEELAPGLGLPAAALAAHYPDEGWVDGPGITRALVARAKAAGARFVDGAEAVELLVRQGVVHGVRTAAGDVLDADVVVSAAGRWTHDFLARSGLEVPLVSVDGDDPRPVGLLAYVRPAPDPPPCVLHSPRVNWAPQPGGRAVLASSDADLAAARDRSPEALAAAARTLLQEAAQLDPRFAAAGLVDAVVGLRALPADGRTVCGWVGAIRGAYVVVTHSGITLAPLLSRLVAAELADGVEAPQLATFRPSRFDAGVAG